MGQGDIPCNDYGKDRGNLSKTASFPGFSVITGNILVLAAVLLAARTASPNHPADQERQNAQPGHPPGCGNAALRRGSRLSGGCGRFLRVKGTCQEKSRQGGSGKHAMLEKGPFHLS